VRAGRLRRRPIARRALALALTAATLAGASTVSASGDATVVAGAEWLLGQQAASGLYPWTVGQPVNPDAAGAVARGMLGAYVASADGRYATSSLRTGDALIGSPPRQFPDGSPDFFPNDVLFLEELSLATGEPRFASFVQTNFWNRLATGTYGANHDLDAGEWALVMPEWPQYASWTSLKPFYRAVAAVAAHQAGELQARNAFMVDLVRTLELAAGTDKRADLTGLAAAVWASAHTGINIDPRSGRWRNHNSTADFVATIVAYQRAGGDWPYDTSAMASRHVGDVSVTTWAATALEAWDAVHYSDNIARGIAFIRSQQQPSGQILTNPGYPPTTETGVLVHADAIGAIALRGGIVTGPVTPPPGVAPTAAFAATPTSGVSPMTVAFTDASAGSPTAWAWDFQDDGVVDSTAQHPQFTYTAPGVYTVRLTVSNAQGSDDEVKIGLIAVSAPPSSTTFVPTDDAYVLQGNPTTNFGQATTLRARPGVASYLKFTLSGTQGPSRLTLRLHVTDATSGTVTAHAVPDTSWSESAITWATAPPTGEARGSTTAPTAGVWIELDLGIVPSDGSYSFAVTNSKTDVVWFSSSEGASPPELLVSPAQ
jgi:PKD repeat protein